jgi:hypothetical protein
VKITIEPTNEVVIVDGIQCRVWAGVTGGGVKCHVVVHGIAINPDADTSELDAELTLEPPEKVKLRMRQDWG